MLSSSVPSFITGNSNAVSYRLKALDILRPGIDVSQIALRPLPVPVKRQHLFVASISDSQFNQLGVHHATHGVRRILGIPNPSATGIPGVISSRDRLAYDVSRALERGYRDFHQLQGSNSLRTSRSLFGVSSRSYASALETMLHRVNKRLERERLEVEPPNIWNRWFGRGTQTGDGYRNRIYSLPIRSLSSDKSQRQGRLEIEMRVYDRQFQIPDAPTSKLYLN